MTTTQEKLKLIADELNSVHLERYELTHAALVTLVARQHLLALSEPGTGKTYFFKDVLDRVSDASTFATALDETGDPVQLFGPYDIKAMASEGKSRRVTTGMAPEADLAFIDEFFNANGPTLRSMQPWLNEREFPNDGRMQPTPLWSAFMATNKLNAEPDLHALWDRIPIRLKVGYVRDRDSLRNILVNEMQRRSLNATPPERTRLTLQELQEAHELALALPVPDETMDAVLNIKDELQSSKGIVVSTRRVVDGLVTCKANAFVNGHTQVTVGDLEILQFVWWQTLDDREPVREMILMATNPTEREALKLLEDVVKEQSSLSEAGDPDIDPTRRNNIRLEVYGQAKKLREKGEQLIQDAHDNGSSTRRAQELVDRSNRLISDIEKSLGLS